MTPHPSLSARADRAPTVPAEGILVDVPDEMRIAASRGRGRILMSGA
jgi:hypothetical protein